MGLSGAGCGWAAVVFCGSWVSAMDRGSQNFCIFALDRGSLRWIVDRFSVSFNFVGFLLVLVGFDFCGWVCGLIGVALGAGCGWVWVMVLVAD